MRLKLCGLSREADIEAVNRARPDYAGFVVNFPKSHRSVTPERVRALCARLDSGVQPVGVFVDEPVEQVAALCADTLAVAQLHGSEDEAYIAALRALTDRPIWQAFRLRAAEDAARANASTADLILLDAGQGTGTAFDWSLLRLIERPFALAGGLNEGNLAAAAETGAILLDVSSGVETDGLKDARKIERITQGVRAMGAE